MGGTAGVVGLGDMGSGLAKNLLKAGFTVKGFDLSEKRLGDFAAMGGTAATSAAQAGEGTDFVFVMVMTGAQAASVILGSDSAKGLKDTMPPDGVILLTATIKANEAREIAAGLEGSGIHLIDTPVSGGFPGAQGGTLTMMAAGSDEALEKAQAAMQAVSATIHRVGSEAGMGQTVKACLQALIGSIFTMRARVCIDSVRMPA